MFGFGLVCFPSVIPICRHQDIKFLGVFIYLPNTYLVLNFILCSCEKQATKIVLLLREHVLHVHKLLNFGI